MGMVVVPTRIGACGCARPCVGCARVCGGSATACGCCACGGAKACGCCVCGDAETCGCAKPNPCAVIVSIITGAVPVTSMSRCSAAACERSIIRPSTKGPRSFTLTETCRLLFVLVTISNVPKGRVGWAAVKREELKISPDAVGLPSNWGPYQEAIPSCRKTSPVGVGNDWAVALAVANRAALI